jgi:molecular chaperone IbpA
MVTKRYTVSDINEILDNFKPFTVGYERLFDTLITNSPETYPPYNIIRNTDENFTIEIAAAGFKEEELTVNHLPETNKLTISGSKEQTDESSVKNYTYRGIANRNFTRTFSLAPDVEVLEAKFSDGILSVTLERIVPDEKKPKTITINKTVKKSKPQTLNES